MKKKQLTILATIFAMAVAAQADVIVAWGPTTNDIVTATQNMTIGNTFSTASLTSPTVGPDYYPNNAGKNPDFYAAVDSTGNIGSYSVWNGGSFDLLNRFQNNNSGAAGTREFMSAWDVSSSQTVESFTLHRLGAFGLPAPNAEVRFLIQDSIGDWYASAGIAHAADNTNVLLPDASATTWYDYTPHNGGAPVIGGAQAANLTDVQRAGYYIKWDTDGTGGTFSTGFEVTAIPEPATFGLLGMAFAGLLIARRRRG